MNLMDVLSTGGVEPGITGTPSAPCGPNDVQAQDSPACFSIALTSSLQSPEADSTRTRDSISTGSCVVVKQSANVELTNTGDESEDNSAADAELSGNDYSQILSGTQFFPLQLLVPVAVSDPTRSSGPHGATSLAVSDPATLSFAADNSGLPQIAPQLKPPALPAALLQSPGASGEDAPAGIATPSNSAPQQSATRTPVVLPVTTGSQYMVQDGDATPDVIIAAESGSARDSRSMAPRISSVAVSKAPDLAQERLQVQRSAVGGDAAGNPDIETVASPTDSNTATPIQQTTSVAAVARQVQEFSTPNASQSTGPGRAETLSSSVASVVAADRAESLENSPATPEATIEKLDASEAQSASSQAPRQISLAEKPPIDSSTASTSNAPVDTVTDGLLTELAALTSRQDHDLEDEANGNPDRQGNDSQETLSLANAGTTRTDRTERIHSASEPEPSVEVSRVIADTAHGIVAAHHDGNEIHLRLDPPNLGALRIDVAIREGQLTARLEAERSSSHRLLSDNLPELRDQLSQQGVQVDRIEVVHAGERSGAGNLQTASQSFRQQERQPPSNPAFSGRDARHDSEPEQNLPEGRPPAARGSRGRLRQLDIIV